MKRTQLQPDIQYLLDTFTENLKTNLNCVQVGQIVKFYPENKTVDVNICFKQKVNGEIKNYPLLLKCPVLGNKITIPIEEGEFCIVLFNDRNIDSWWETGQSQLPRTNDKHNISDGIVICGLNSLANAIQYDNSAICLNYQQTKINGNLEVNGNTTQNGDNTITGNNEAATYSTGGEVGVSGVFVDTGAGASGKTLTIKNGLITNIA